MSKIALQFLLCYNNNVYHFLYSEGGFTYYKKLNGVLKHTKTLGGFNSILMLSLTVSIFLPFYITLACMIFLW